MVAAAKPGPDRSCLGGRFDDDDIHDAPSAARGAGRAGRTRSEHRAVLRETGNGAARAGP